jgi:hypothetical protein
MQISNKTKAKKKKNDSKNNSSHSSSNNSNISDENKNSLNNSGNNNKEKNSNNNNINLEKELNINKNNLNQALIKIKIIKAKIDFLQRQKDDLSTNNKKGQLSRLISINNIINNRNYRLIDNNDNSIYDKETLENRK